MDTIRPDEMIETDLADHIRWDTRIPQDDADIDFSVEQGRVTITGTVPNMAARQAVSDGAWLITGVLAVDNQLAVQPQREAAATGGEIKSRLESMLLWNPALSSLDVDVATQHGVVTLTGTVNNYWEKRRAEEYACQLEGVQDVRNNMTVQPEGPTDDQMIAEQIRAAIARDSRISLDHQIDVEVRNGRVTLSGTVSGWSAKAAAFDSACYTPGVTAVEDEVRVLRDVAP